MIRVRIIFILEKEKKENDADSILPRYFYNYLKIDKASRDKHSNINQKIKIIDILLSLSAVLTIFFSFMDVIIVI
jgi:hypothetical protein